MCAASFCLEIPFQSLGLQLPPAKCRVSLLNNLLTQPSPQQNSNPGKALETHWRSMLRTSMRESWCNKQGENEAKQFGDWLCRNEKMCGKALQFAGALSPVTRNWTQLKVSTFFNRSKSGQRKEKFFTIACTKNWAVHLCNSSGTNKSSSL